MEIELCSIARAASMRQLPAGYARSQTGERYSCSQEMCIARERIPLG